MAGEEQGKEQVDESAAVRAENEALKGRLGEYERMLMAPDYLEYLAKQQRGEDTGSRRANGGGERRASERESESPAKPAVDLDSMTNSQLAAYLLRNFRTYLDQSLGKRVQPIEEREALNAAKAEIAEMERNYPDFHKYQKDIVDKIRRVPQMSLEDAYLSIKGKEKPAPRTVSGATPTGGGGLKKKPTQGFEAAFEQAWREAGLPEPTG